MMSECKCVCHVNGIKINLMSNPPQDCCNCVALKITDEQDYDTRINKLEAHINKLHDMINLEDRITSGDVLCRLTVLEDKVDIIKKDFSGFDDNSDYDERIANLEKIDTDRRLNNLERYISLIESLNNCRHDWIAPFSEAQNSCISNNIILSEKVDKLTKRVDYIAIIIPDHEKYIKNIEQLVYDEKEKFRGHDRKPHKCPVCEGWGKKELPDIKDKFVDCNACDGKGIVWG